MELPRAASNIPESDGVPNTEAVMDRNASIAGWPCTVNALGISARGYQTVPILCYHRVGARANPMIMPRETFAAQMEYLARNNSNVIRLADLPDFLSGKRPLPPRAVVITFDDGHVSSYQHAYPILRQHGFPATFFVYTDFLGSGEGLADALDVDIGAF